MTIEVIANRPEQQVEQFVQQIGQQPDYSIRAMFSKMKEVARYDGAPGARRVTQIAYDMLLFAGAAKRRAGDRLDTREQRIDREQAGVPEYAVGYARVLRNALREMERREDSELKSMVVGIIRHTCITLTQKFPTPRDY